MTPRPRPGGGGRRERGPDGKRQGQRGEGDADRAGRRPGTPHRPEQPVRPDAPSGASVDVGATANSPELLETLAIVTEPGKGRRVVLSLGAETKTETPLPDLAPGDRLLAFAELELTTDAEDPAHPGLVGNAYSYAPDVEATLLLAADAEAVEAKPGRAIELARTPWRQTVSHERHHAVVTFGDAETRLPGSGLPWKGGSYINLVVGASSSEAKSGDVLLVGQNEKTPTVVQDMAGIRLVRFRPGDVPAPPAEHESACLCAGIPIAKQETVVLSHLLSDLEQGEQILVRGILVTDATGLAAPARISTRMFLADAPNQTEPGGTASSSLTWKGHLSKFTGFNCLPDEGPQTSSKYGVAAVRRAPGRDLYVNLVAVSAAPFGGLGAGDQLRIDTAGSALDVTRFPAADG